MTRPDSVDPHVLVTPELLTERLPKLLGHPVAARCEVRIERLKLGTSGAAVYSVTVPGEPDAQLILKVGKTPTEALFYGKLASRICVSTPRVVAWGTVDTFGWVLMERVEAKPSETWTDIELESVVREMARFHASNWNNTDQLRADWLTEITESAAIGLAQERIDHIAGLRPTWVVNPVSGLFTEEDVRLMERLLQEITVVAHPLWEAGLTLVHGDYWFYNVLLTDGGRQVLVDWQEPMIWSGFWELAYFLNLLAVLGSNGYRELPVPEAEIAGWYRAELARLGQCFDDRQFAAALHAGGVIHPLIHWIPQLAGAAARPEYAVAPEFEAARGYFRRDFQRWRILAESTP